MFAVYLHHPNGSELEVYLHGANITSWRKPDGSDILFLQPDNEFDGVEPIKCVPLRMISQPSACNGVATRIWHPPSCS
jgi:Aldose 1-epimerase